MPRGRHVNGGQWLWEPRPPGPIALVLQSAAVHNTDTDTAFTHASQHAHDYNIIEAPVHYVKKSIYMISEGAAFHSLAFNRKTFSGIRKIVRAVTLKLPNTIPQCKPSGGQEDNNQRPLNQHSERRAQKSKQNALNIEAAGLPTDYQQDSNIGEQHPKAQLIRNCPSDNLWSPARAFKSGQQDTDACPFCHETKGTTRHVFWECPSFAEARNRDTTLKGLIPDTDLLPGILAAHGWAPALHLDPTQAF